MAPLEEGPRAAGRPRWIGTLLYVPGLYGLGWLLVQPLAFLVPALPRDRLDLVGTAMALLLLLLSLHLRIRRVWAERRPWRRLGVTAAPALVAQAFLRGLLKAALLGLTKAWAKELAPWNINVNALAPGGVWTEMELAQRGPEGIREAEARVPLGRWSQPEEQSESVLFLVTDRSSFITGQCISANGGSTIVGI